MRRPARWGALLVLAVLLGGCAGEELSVPARRLVDPPGGGAPASATLRDEQRLVLRGIPRALLVDRQWVAVPPSARVRVRHALPESLAGAERLVLSPKVRVQGRWKRGRAHVTPVVRKEGAALVDTRLKLPARHAGRRVLLVVEAHAADPVPPFESEPFAVPDRARLRFGFGVLEPAWRQGAVSFQVAACEGSRCETLFEETLDPSEPAGRGWQDRRVSLAALAGRERSLRFETRPADPHPEAYTLPVWSNPTVLSDRPRRPDERSLLLISLDTLRADRLSVYGHPHDTTPFLASHFGAGGAVFEAFVASATTTRPAHASLFTSLPSSVHRLLGPDAVLPPDATTLAEALRAAGFTTGAATENGALDATNGMGRGFESWFEDKRRENDVAEGAIEDTLARGLDWLEQHRNRRFFLFLHTYQTHAPYTPPPEYRDLFGEGDAALYDGEIRYVDDALRRFFEGFDALGLDHRTLVVVTSDHGEEFREHGGVGHGPHLHAEVVNVPLLLRGPGIPRGLRIAEPAAHVDLMPTLLELLGVSVPTGLRGASLAPRLRGDAGPGSRPLFSETLDRSDGRLDVAVRVGPRKLIRIHTPAGPRHRYYDLAADPGEQHDRYAERAGQLGELMQLLDAHAAAASTPAPPRPPPPFDPAREEKLRALGYID